MTQWAAILACGLLSACDVRPNVTQPPKAYQGDAVALVMFSSDAGGECAKRGIDPGHRACALNLTMSQTIGVLLSKGLPGLMIVPNVADWPDQGGDVGRIQTHEKAHLLGGKHDASEHWFDPNAARVKP